MVNLQQQSMKTDVFLLFFIIREIKAVVLGLCARKALGAAFTLWKLGNLAMQTRVHIMTIFKQVLSGALLLSGFAAFLVPEFCAGTCAKVR